MYSVDKPTDRPYVCISTQSVAFEKSPKPLIIHDASSNRIYIHWPSFPSIISFTMPRRGNFLCTYNHHLPSCLLSGLGLQLRLLLLGYLAASVEHHVALLCAGGGLPEVRVSLDDFNWKRQGEQVKETLSDCYKVVTCNGTAVAGSFGRGSGGSGRAFKVKNLAHFRVCRK